MSRNAGSKASSGKIINDLKDTESEIKQDFDKGPLKTPDNYIVLEPENTYTYIDHGDIKDKDKASPNNETKNAKRPSNPGYLVQEPENIPLSKGINKVTENLDMVGTQEIRNHNYFVLEPHNKQTTNTDPQTAPQKSSPDTSDPEKAQNHNYFVLEPQDTYSSIDPDNVIVQTLPENEYNVINMKEKPVNRDPNYGTFKADVNIGKDVEEGGEYSHIQNTPFKKMDTNEYSHTNFKNMKSQPIATGVDNHSQLNSNMT